MERLFDEEINKIKDRLLLMAGLVEISIAESIDALKTRSEEPARSVLRREVEVNGFDVEIDEACLRLLALRQPMAGDLRFLTSAMKINSDLERMGDLAVNIAELDLELIREPLLKPLIDLPRMAEVAQGMVHDAITAFVRHDEGLARSVCERDDVVDSLDEQIFRELLTYMMQDPSTIAQAVDLILVSRNLERIADHATNICEDVVYLVKGKTIKHHVDRVREGGFAPEKNERSGG